MFCPNWATTRALVAAIVGAMETAPDRTLAEQGQSAAAFLARLAALQPIAETRRQTGLSETTIKNARGGVLTHVGVRCITALSRAYGAAFDDFAYGLTADADLAAREARIAALQTEIRELRDGPGGR